MWPVVRVAWLALAAVACGGRSYELAEAPAGDDSSSGGTPSGSSGGASGGSSSSAGEAPDSGGSGGTSTSPTGGANSGGAGNGASDSGGSSGSGANDSGGSAGTGVGDPNCYPGLAQSGESCTVPCTLPCGFADMGTRECDCVGGYYLGCGCPRPPEYLGDRTAPTCSTPDGRAIPLRGTPCMVEWAQCIGTDPVDGSIPRGCACLANELNDGALTWFCGSTNRWFFPE